ncbi:MAG: heme A synthase [Gammaproteobacteria bacterium]|nr:heme A synthase [Gammaproteobacteria bacterium]
MTTAVFNDDDKLIGRWLTLCAATIFGMILLGGVTRLTESGLSMVDWRPIMGVIPPLSTDDWVYLFDQYKLYPEYQLVNAGMSLAEFKQIFWFEYLHRMLGRLIGLMFFIPLMVFLWTGKVRASLKPHLFTLLFLGGCQGLMGWYMVQSGLIDRPDVSQYRLTAHLGLAIAIYAYIVWLAIGLFSPERQQREGATTSVFSIIGLVYLMILSGGFVAGTNAGLSFPTWPLMGDSFIPPALYRDGITSAFEQVTTIHFNHRMLAYVTGVVLIFAALRGLIRCGDTRLRLASILMLTAVCLQIVLGISTVLSHVDITIAAGHQSGAVVLLTTVLFWVHCHRTSCAV